MTVTTGYRGTTAPSDEVVVDWRWASVMVLGIALTLRLAAEGALIWRLAWLVVGVAATVFAGVLWLRQGRAGGVAALLFGVAGMTMGIGMGLRWLAAHVVTVSSVFAAAVFLLGVVVTAMGLARSTSQMRQPIRTVIGAAALLAVVVLVWTLAPAVIATNVPPTSHEATPADFGLVAEEVGFTTLDGVQLWAWYIPPTNGKVVILRHGAGSTASDVLAHAAVFARNLYGVLITDARGHGKSGGEAMDFGWYGDVDLEAAVSFLTGQPEVDPDRIAVVGLSMGGEEAIGAAGSDSRIAAVVAEGATARTDSDKQWLVDEYGWRGWIQVRLEWLQYAFTDLLTDAEKPVALVDAARSAVPRPIMLITAGDVAEEASAAQFIEFGPGDNVFVWTVPRSGHIQGLATAAEEWDDRVVGFLDSALSDG
ncbi:MAG TPA: alpha/beta fold hydrolase [Acidimicrobiia bacterium]